MFRRFRSTPIEITPDEPLPDAADPTLGDDDAWAEMAPRPTEPGLAALPIVGITRRRMAAAVAVLLAIWILGVFVRQVGEASTATGKADDLAADNIALAAHVASLERELELIARPRYVNQQARGYQLGSAKEIPFALAPGAPALPEDAPGSKALAVGQDRVETSPLETWLTVLFGPEG
jgi:hypothetical protein